MEGGESSLMGAGAAASTTSSEGGKQAGEGRGVGGGGGGGGDMSMGTLVASHWPFYQVCFDLLNTLKQICGGHRSRNGHNGRNGRNGHYSRNGCNGCNDCNGQKRNNSLLWQARASLWGLLMVTPTSTHFADLLRNPLKNVDTENGESGEGGTWDHVKS